MKRLIEFSLEDGSTILIEGSEIESDGGIVKAARPGDVITKATQTFDQALNVVKPAAATILKKLRGLADQPDEIEVAFGLKISAEAGAFVAAAGIDSNYTVTLKWKKTDTPKRLNNHEPAA